MAAKKSSKSPKKASANPAPEFTPGQLVVVDGERPGEVISTTETGFMVLVGDNDMPDNITADRLSALPSVVAPTTETPNEDAGVEAVKGAPVPFQAIDPESVGLPSKHADGTKIRYSPQYLRQKAAEKE